MRRDSRLSFPAAVAAQARARRIACRGLPQQFSFWDFAGRQSDFREQWVSGCILHRLDTAPLVRKP